MEKQKRIWLIIAIVVVLLIIVIAWPRQKTEELGLEEVLEGVITEEVEIPVVPEPEIKKFKEPTVIVPEASPVTSEGEVLARTGEVAKNEAVPGTKEAPKPSRVLEEAEVEELAENSIILNVSSATGFVPDQFIVKPGQIVTIVLTVGTDRPHAFRFTGLELTGVAVAANAGQSRAITFKAPDIPGEYPFHCSEGGHKRKGEIGVMIVQE